MTATFTTLSAFHAKSGRTLTIQTPFSDDQALDICRKSSSDFGRDLAAKAGRGLSQAQLFWVHKIACDVSGQAPEPEKVRGLLPIVEMFQNAMGSAKAACVLRVLHNETDTLKIKPAKKYPGSHYVVGGEWPDESYYGRITPDGEFIPSRLGTDEGVVASLRQFAANPKEQAFRYGRVLGHCCFCGRLLTEQISIDLGYGPVCEKKWGLPSR